MCLDAANQDQDLMIYVKFFNSVVVSETVSRHIVIEKYLSQTNQVS